MLNVPGKGSFVVGAQVIQQEQNGTFFLYLPELVTWSATDDSGVAPTYSVFAYPGGPPIKLADHQTETSFLFTATDEDGSWTGEQNVVNRWGIQAFDKAGNSIRRMVYGANLIVTQSDNTTFTNNFGPTIHFAATGTWQAKSDPAFLGGSTRESAAADSAFAIQIDGRIDPGMHRFALLATTGPHRGIADVLIDGNPVGTVDFFSTTLKRRVVVFQHVLTTGFHTVKVVNQATPERPLIDLDAVAVN